VAGTPEVGGNRIAEEEHQLDKQARSAVERDACSVHLES